MLFPFIASDSTFNKKDHVVKYYVPFRHTFKRGIRVSIPPSSISSRKRLKIQLVFSSNASNKCCTFIPYLSPIQVITSRNWEKECKRFTPRVVLLHNHRIFNRLPAQVFKLIKKSSYHTDVKWTKELAPKETVNAASAGEWNAKIIKLYKVDLLP